MTVLDDSDWISVRAAAEQTNTPVRTLYARAANGTLESRKTNGILQVRASQCASAAQPAMQPRLAANDDTATAIAQHDTGDPATKEVQMRIVRARLEREESNAVAAARVAKQAADEESERVASRKRVTQLDAQRAQIELSHLEWKLAQEREAAQAEAMERARIRTRDQEADRMKRQRAEQENTEARRKVEWLEDWENQVTTWARRRVGPTAWRTALTVAREVLSEFGPHSDDETVADELLTALRGTFAAELHQVDEDKKKQHREEVIQRATQMPCALADPAGKSRIMAAVEKAALTMDVDRPDVLSHLSRVAQSELQAIRNEEGDRRWADAERWRGLEQGLARFVNCRLPTTTSADDRARVLRDAEAFLRDSRDRSTASNAEFALGQRLDAEARALAERAQRAEWNRLRGTFDEHLRQLPANASDADRADLERRLDELHRHMNPSIPPSSFHHEARRLVQRAKDDIACRARYAS